MQIDTAVDARNEVGEGPFWDERTAALWWVDIPSRAIFRWEPAGGGAPKVWRIPHFPSAVVLGERGGAMLATDQGVFSFDITTGEIELFCRLEPERPGNRSNEAKCGPDGCLWVGTMQNNFELDGSDRAMDAVTGALYRVRPDGEVTREVDDVGLSNTLAWTDGGRRLLFGDTKTGAIRSFEVRDDGRLGAHRVFNQAMPAGHCDGSTVDGHGFLWNCRFGGSRIVRWAPDGTVQREIMLPVTNPTSCCFGGPDLRTLYVTSARRGLATADLARNPLEGAVLAIAVDVPGTPSQRFGG